MGVRRVLGQHFVFRPHLDPLKDMHTGKRTFGDEVPLCVPQHLAG
jgi:hypothetical protein